MRLNNYKKILLGSAIGLLLCTPIFAQAQLGMQGSDIAPLPATSDVTQQANLQKYGGAAQTALECNGVTECIAVIIYYIGPGLASNVAYVGAYFFSLTIQLSLNSTAYALDFLTEGWTTVRDLANMAFIFILIYISMTVMLQAETTGTVKTLAIVIVVALLVNFSFFFTRVVIDTGNILAVQFYNAIDARGPDGKQVIIAGTDKGSVGGVKDLSAAIMGAIGPQTLLSSEMFKKATEVSKNSKWGALGIFTVIYLSMAVMLWMLFFAFLQVGVKFMLRIVGLWFVLIVSPLAFVARTMHSTEQYFKKWLDALIQFSVYPAVFLFMFLILTKFATAVLTINTSQGKQGDFLGSIVNSLSASSAGAEQGILTVIASVAIRLGFIIALLYVGLRVSDMVVKEGSAIANKVSGNLTGRALGAAGFVGRNTVGFAGYRLGQTKFMQNVGSKGVVGRNLLAGVNRVGTASFDARNSKAAKNILGTLGGALDTHGKITPLDFGNSVNKKGYKGDFDARVKALQKEAEQFKKPSAEEKTNAKESAQKSFDEEHGGRREEINVRVAEADKAHKPFAARATELEKELSGAKNETQKDNIKSLITEHTAASQTTLTALARAQADKAAFEKEEKEKVTAAAEKMAPNFREQFAKHISSNEANLFRTFSLWVPKSHTEAAAKIRKGKSKSDELMEKIKEIQEDEHGEGKKEEKGGNKKEDKGEAKGDHH